MRIDILSIFPEMFPPVLGESIMGIAQEKKLAEFYTHDIRNWSDNKHRKIDDKPFGGGPGMVMKAEPVVAAVEEVRNMTSPAGRLLFMSPQGKKFDQKMAAELAREERLCLVCGRYEGFDERILDALQPEEVSVGDYVLTGGELAAMIIADAAVRLIPGVLGSNASLEHESFENGLLDFPQYTQPFAWRGIEAPEILRSGNHALIEEWRREEALKKTKARRPDLFDK
ncbi:MAG: tRNA (guanosine(37)-N1)-methyltransferase TrmD [Planctomycetota bacterium]|jgi:tRNA (guanine37-N1)-methyltransferase